MGAVFTNEENTQISWTNEQGQVWSVPYPLADGQISKQVQEWLDAGNSISPYPPIPKEQLVKEAKHRIISELNLIADFITGLVPLAERESWYKKELAARKYVADPNSLSSEELTLLQNELNLTGALDTDLPTLATKIIEMADLYSAVAGKIAGLRRVAMADLDALPDDATQDQVNAVRDAAITQAWQQIMGL